MVGYLLISITWWNKDNLRIEILSHRELLVIIKVMQDKLSNNQSKRCLPPLYSLSLITCKKWPFITKSQKEKFQFPSTLLGLAVLFLESGSRQYLQTSPDFCPPPEISGLKRGPRGRLHILFLFFAKSLDLKLIFRRSLGCKKP